MLTVLQEQTTVPNLPEKVDIDIHNITCPRCRFKIENAAEGDIRTKLCDHCLQNLEKINKYKCQLLQKKETKPSFVHSDIELSLDVLKSKQRLVTRKKSKPDFPPTKISPLFDLLKDIQLRPPKSDAGPSHVKEYLRPIISKNGKSEADFKLISEIESDNQQITTTKNVAFSSDDSVVTSFITSFDEKVPSQKFKYVFPAKELKRTSQKNVHKSSSELIAETIKGIKKYQKTKPSEGNEKFYAERIKQDEIDGKFTALEKKTQDRVPAKPEQEKKATVKSEQEKKTAAKQELEKKLVQEKKTESDKKPKQEKKTETDKKPIQEKKTESDKKPIQEKKTTEKPDLEKKSIQKKKLTAKPELKNQTVKTEILYPLLKKARGATILDITAEQAPVTYNKQGTKALTKPGQEKKLPAKPELEKKPVQEKKLEPEKKPLQAKKSELEKKPVQEKNTESEKKLAQEKKPEPEKKPIQEKKSEPEKKPAQEKKSELEKKPIQETKSEPKEKQIKEKKPEPEKKPAQEKKSELEKKTIQEKISEPEKKQIQEKKPEPEKKPGQDKKLEPEKKPVQEKKSEPEKKPVQEKRPDSEKKPAEEKKSKVKETKKEPAKPGKENKLPEGKVTPGKIEQEVVTPEARKYDKITETKKPIKEEPKTQEDLVLDKMLRGQTDKSKDIEREKRAMEFKKLFMKQPTSIQSQKQTKPQRTDKKQNTPSDHQKIEKRDEKKIAKENIFKQKQMIQAELIFGKDIVLKKSVTRSPSVKPGQDELFRTKFNADIHTYADVSESPQTTGGGRRLGMTSYALSNPKYIENGWTVLPQQKCIQKVNIYGMRPSQPEYDWFKHNKHRGVIYHEDTCEKMAEIDDNGCGRWYYNNGQLALDYYECEEENVRKRFVVYSKSETGSRDGKTGSVLAMFDYQGNGVVYDEHGNIRIKYTQSEGVVMDRTIGPYCTWKWHNLNDPPVLQAIVSDNLSPYPDPYISSLDPDDVKIREDDEEMLAIEFTNFIKERSKKMKQKYQQYPIRTKALKINDQFALKILDQEHIYLKFMEGSTNIKINIGVTLNPNEILQSDVTDVGIVTNRLERRPARSRSLYDLQTNIKQFRRHQRHLDDHAKKIRPTVPVLSADKLLVDVSKPLRLPILPVKSETKSYKDEHPTLFEMCYDNPGVLVK